MSSINRNYRKKSFSVLFWQEDSLKTFIGKTNLGKKALCKGLLRKNVFQKMSVGKKEDPFRRTPSNGHQKKKESNVWKYDLLGVLKLDLYSKGLRKVDRLKFFYEWIPFKDLQLKNDFQRFSMQKEDLWVLLWEKGL